MFHQVKTFKDKPISDWSFKFFKYQIGHLSFKFVLNNFLNVLKKYDLFYTNLLLKGLI
jgi:hypothetical protein